jgi:hypothetical protein
MHIRAGHSLPVLAISAQPKSPSVDPRCLYLLVYSRRGQTQIGCSYRLLLGLQFPISPDSASFRVHLLTDKVIVLLHRLPLMMWHNRKMLVQLSLSQSAFRLEWADLPLSMRNQFLLHLSPALVIIHIRVLHLERDLGAWVGGGSRARSGRRGALCALGQLLLFALEAGKPMFRSHRRE